MKTIFVLIGPSGTGKTTLGMYLKSLGIPELVSHTTRKPRIGEIDGESYYFLENKYEFDKIEKIESVEYGGNYYCLSKKEVDNKLKMNYKVFAITDKNGLKSLKNKYGDIIQAIFITAPQKDLEKRMKNRGDCQKSISKRKKHAKKENEFDNFVYADWAIVNKELDKSKKRIRDIVFNQEKAFELNHKLKKLPKDCIKYNNNYYCIVGETIICIDEMNIIKGKVFSNEESEEILKILLNSQSFWKKIYNWIQKII